MEGQNTFKSFNKMLPKTLYVILRGIIWGIIGAFAAGMLVGITLQLFNFFYYILPSPGSDLNRVALDVSSMVSIGRSIIKGIEDVVIFCVPIGFIMGFSTGTLAVIFGRHCPKLQWWLALSLIGVATGSWFAAFTYVGATDSLPFGALLLITFISSAASWMAYKSTIREIKKSNFQETSQPFTFFASLSNLLLVFIMIYEFVYLLEGANVP